MKRFIRNILLPLNILLALALLISYAANYLTPAIFWPIAFLGLAYPYLLVLNILFLIIWGLSLNKLMFISLIAIVLGFANIGKFFQLNGKTIQDNNNKNTLKIISYNVRIFNTYHWQGKKFERDSIISYVNSENPDIICFQEFITQSDINNQTEGYTNQLLEGTPNHHIRYTLAANNNKRKFGIATFTKHKIICRGSIIFNNSFNSCIYSDILFNSDTIRVYNVHLQSISLRKYYSLQDSLVYLNAKRIEEIKDISQRLKKAYILRAQQVDAVKKHMDQSPYPVILCGDFNDTPVSYSYHQLLGNRADAFKEAGFGLGKTYLGKLPSFRIDYIFHDKNYKTIDYNIPKVMLSDHLPVLTTLAIN